MEGSNCTKPGTDPTWWTPMDRLPGAPRGYKRKYLPWLARSAELLCAGCPVVDQCAQVALTTPDVTGIFAGIYIPPSTQKAHEQAITRLAEIKTRRSA